MTKKLKKDFVIRKKNNFIIKMLDYETQKELLKKRVNPNKALRIDIYLEKVRKLVENQLTTTNSASINVVASFSHNENCNTFYSYQRQYKNRNTNALQQNRTSFKTRFNVVNNLFADFKNKVHIKRP